MSLPKDWHRSTLGEIGNIKSGGTPPRANHERYFGNGIWPWVKTMDLTNGQIEITDERITDVALKETPCKLFPAGTVLVAMYGGFKQIGRTGLLREKSAVNQAISAIELDDKRAVPQYVMHWLNGSISIWKSFAASSRKDPNITRDDVCSFPINLPPVGEQVRIARILSTWDQAIATTERLLANSRTQKGMLTNTLLTGKRRLSKHRAWTNKKLAELIIESRIRGSGGDAAKKITVKLYGRGVVSKSEKRLGSESTQYYRRSAGQFIYSKLDFLNGAFGRIPEALDGYESTLDLPAFDFLPGVDPRWFLSFVSREEFYLGQLGLANGGRKARRVNPLDLLPVSIPVPQLVEQKSIADVLDAAQAEVINLTSQLTLLREQKMALMAQLFTGKRRVRKAKLEAETAA